MNNFGYDIENTNHLDLDQLEHITDYFNDLYEFLRGDDPSDRQGYKLNSIAEEIKTTMEHLDYLHEAIRNHRAER